MSKCARNAAGLHARPATAFVDLASGFTSEIRAEYGEKIANGKALASLLRLGVESNKPIRIDAWGADADARLAAPMVGAAPRRRCCDCDQDSVIL